MVWAARQGCNCREIRRMLRAMMKLISLSLLLLSLCAAGCSADVSDKPTEPANIEPAKNAGSADNVVPATGGMPANSDAAAKPFGPQTKEVAVREAKCGCSIEGVGHCGNYVMVEGKYVPLIHPSLGKMEFCKHKAAGVKIKVAGLMKDGNYVAEQWKVAK